MKRIQQSVSRKVLFQLYEKLQGQIRSRLLEFRNVPPQHYIYELFYCLLTPQSRAQHAAVVVQKLKESDFAHRPFDPTDILRDSTHYIRFHKTKSQNLLAAQAQQQSILCAIDEIQSPLELRQFLVKTVRGFGYKEATHFLRNIGRNDNCAILDRHILRLLHNFKVIHTIPPSLPPSLYEEIESKFQIFAEQTGIPINELDLLFWYLATGKILK